MQAILTRYHGPTNVKGSRYSATCERGRVILPANAALNPEGNHKEACAALVARFVAEDLSRYGTVNNPWAVPRVAGTLPSGDMAHVFLPRL
jgi:hypothetical protein